MLVPNKPKKKNEAIVSEPISFNIEPDTLRVDFNKEVTQTVVFTIQGKIILTLGSLLVITGKPKARKSTFLHSFIGSALKNDTLWSITGKLPENRKKIVLIDTEQSLYDIHVSIKRMALNLSIDLNSGDFIVYTARAIDVTAIMSLIDKVCCDQPEISVIAIDGLVDLVNDINDVKEAKLCVSYLKNIADKYNIAIIGVLHQNKSTNFSLGHLGSFLSRFAQSELSVIKEEENSKLEATFLRSSDNIEPITIGWDSVNNRYDTLENINIGQLSYSGESILSEIYSDKLALSYKDLLIKAKSIIPESTYYIEKKLIPYWYSKGLLKKIDGLVQFTPF